MIPGRFNPVICGIEIGILLPQLLAIFQSSLVTREMELWNNWNLMKLHGQTKLIKRTRIRTATKTTMWSCGMKARDQFEHPTTESGLLFWHSLGCSAALILIHINRRQCHHPVIIMTNDPTIFQVHGPFIACHAPALPWCEIILSP